LKIPVYLYEKAAADPARSNLAVIRAGEYEGFAEKIKQSQWKPDYGDAVFNERAGATVIGAREFLVAYNANLNTRSGTAGDVGGFDVRENGRVKTDDGTPTGKPVLDANGEPLRVPGKLKHVKAIGWYVEEYGMAQVSMNLTNLEETPLHAAFDACDESATSRGLRVTGSEIVGLLPKKCLIDAGRHYLRKQKWSEGASEEELIDIAVRSMGLGELKPFDPKEKIIEYKIAAGVKEVARADESPAVLQRNAERLAGARRWFRGRVDGGAGRLVRWNGGQPFRRQTRLGRQARLLQRLGCESAAVEGRTAVSRR
jgi:glutamate formiminotransferase/formiminotetrahydrofolate cyclodeaminase